MAAVLPETLCFQTQLPITLPESEPEPDGAVVLAPESRYDDRHPRPSEIRIAIEVSDTSLELDRTVKLAIYASARR